MTICNKRIFSVFLFLFLVVAAFFVFLQNKYVVPIMMYHSVDYSERTTGNNTNPRNFEKQMQFLKDHGYKVISLEELVNIINGQKPLPKKSVVITFDDGFRNNYNHAFPILKEYGYLATIFVITSVVGEAEHLTWAQIKEMENHGIAISSHTLDHVYLPGTSEHIQNHQIAESKKVLEQKLGHPVDFFCYPSGGFNDPIKKMVQKAGYKAACTTNRGYALLNKDVYELKRIRFNDRDYPLSLWVKLSGFYNFFKAPRDPY